MRICMMLWSSTWTRTDAYDGLVSANQTALKYELTRDVRRTSGEVGKVKHETVEFFQYGEMDRKQT